jgi:general secretion pathway protein F
VKTFDYRGFDAGGKPKRGLIEALSIKEARERLAAEGILAETLAPTGRQLRLTVAMRSVVYRELSALLQAGLPLVKAFDLLVDAPEVGGARSTMASVRDRVREGQSLARAFQAASASVTAFEVSIIEAAEQTAMVADVLERLADFLEDQEQLKQSVQAALVYPAIVVTAGICVALVMLGVLIPRTQSLLSGGATLPGLTRFMIGLGQVAVRAAVPVALAVILGVVGLRRRLGRDDAFRVRWDRGLFAWPLLGPGYTLLVNERFARTMALLLEGGVTVIDAFSIAGRATGSAWVSALAETESEAVRHGASLSSAITRIPPLSGVLPGWIRIGEAGGGMARLLSSAAHRYHVQWQRFVKTRLSILEPVIILVIGGFVLMITLAVLLPVMKISQGL